MKETETRVSQAVNLGVWSSGKDSTRRYRVEFYLGRVMKAKIEVDYYEKMLRLEEQKASLAARSLGPVDVECEELAAEIRVLRLQEQACRLRDAVSGSDKEEAREEDGEGEGEEVLASDGNPQVVASEFGCRCQQMRYRKRKEESA